MKKGTEISGNNTFGSLDHAFCGIGPEPLQSVAKIMGLTN